MEIKRRHVCLFYTLFIKLAFHFFRLFFFVNVVTIQPTPRDIYLCVIQSIVLVCQMKHINRSKLSGIWRHASASCRLCHSQSSSLHITASVHEVRCNFENLSVRIAQPPQPVVPPDWYALVQACVCSNCTNWWHAVCLEGSFVLQ